jgi:hypothetical protein
MMIEGRNAVPNQRSNVIAVVIKLSVLVGIVCIRLNRSSRTNMKSIVNTSQILEQLIEATGELALDRSPKQLHRNVHEKQATIELRFFAITVAAKAGESAGEANSDS